MSWNKNTVVQSQIPSIIGTLESLGISYDLQTIGKVRGYGLNDQFGYGDNDEDGMYTLRELRYTTKDGLRILREQMQRTSDCDSDDYIISFDIQEGQTLPLELEEVEEEYLGENMSLAEMEAMSEHYANFDGMQPFEEATYEDMHPELIYGTSAETVSDVTPRSAEEQEALDLATAHFIARREHAKRNRHDPFEKHYISQTL